MADQKALIKTFAFLSFGTICWLSGLLSFLPSLAAAFGLYLATGGWRFTKVVLKTLPRDARGGIFLIVSKLRMKKILASGGNVVTLFQEKVASHPDKLALICIDGRTMTFREVDEYSNQVANYLHDAGYQKGDSIAIFMENCAEYACMWLGMAKVGVAAALVNFNLRGDSLANCINAAKAKGVIYQDSFTSAIQDIQQLIESDTKLMSFGVSRSDSSAIHFDEVVQKSSTEKPSYNPKTGFHEKLLYIYTSGTTGLPKAAIVIHSRFFYMAYSTHYFFRMNSDDVIYDTLPLYHSAGGILGVGQAFLNGCTVVIRKKFSASRYWDDCIKYNCSVMQYIGEMCRYLLAQPHKPAEDQHRVRIAYGNGLRPQIWREFRRRFHIKIVGEFYGATEGNAGIVNIDNKVGAIGFTTRIVPSLYPVALIKVDETTGEPIRGHDGLCIQCEPGEPGEMVGKIVKGDPLRNFDGYANATATSKKIANDVITKGDQVFLTGDILVMDEYGYMFFKDRTGDTFRWRGENVSTAEVEATVSNIIKLKDACVYGVEVPGAEGRAGMAAIVDENHSLDMEHLYSELGRTLPAYARPLFIRLLTKLDSTGTFKLRKVDYRNEGFDPNKISDALFVMDAKAATYVPLTPKKYEEIRLGKLRL